MNIDEIIHHCVRVATERENPDDWEKEKKRAQALKIALGALKEIAEIAECHPGGFGGDAKAVIAKIEALFSA